MEWEANQQHTQVTAVLQHSLTESCMVCVCPADLLLLHSNTQSSLQAELHCSRRGYKPCSCLQHSTVARRFVDTAADLLACCWAALASSGLPALLSLDTWLCNLSASALAFCAALCLSATSAAACCACWLACAADAWLASLSWAAMLASCNLVLHWTATTIRHMCSTQAFLDGQDWTTST